MKSAMTSLAYNAKRAAALAALTIGLFVAGVTTASAVVCPANVVHQFAIDTVGATCGASGNGTFNGNQPFFNPYVFLDRVPNDTNQQANEGAADGSLTMTGLNTLSGSFAIAPPSGYSGFLLALQTVTSGTNPDWATFLLPTGGLSGLWQVTGSSAVAVRGLLYGIANVSAVPLPAGLPLLAAGLGLLGILGARRRHGSRNI